MPSPREQQSNASDGFTASGQLLRDLRVTATPDGGLRIEAPPEAASTRAALFETMAKALCATSNPSGGEPRG